MNLVKTIKNISYAVDGNKTYVIAFITAAVNLAVAFNWVSPEHLDQINIVLGAFGIAAVRSALKKV
jgi:hypothetical protein